MKPFIAISCSLIVALLSSSIAGYCFLISWTLAEGIRELLKNSGAR